MQVNGVKYMDVKLELERVYTNRFLQSRKEISEFEGSLSDLIGLSNPSIITELCMAFDDDTEQYEEVYQYIRWSWLL